MHVKRIGYLGLRADDLAGMTLFFRDLLGLAAVGEGDTVSFQRLPTHHRDLLEVYEQEHRDNRVSTLPRRPAWEMLRNLDFPQRFPCTPTLKNAPLAPKEKAPFSGAFAEPSDGLEPSTPSL